jgi:bifunctional non-homologous end joining protein LigD
MSLTEYRRKRDFGITSEPPPVRKRSSSKPIFVVQEHHATRLHYDFRLEVDGVLKSWAVTKEPSLDPSVKRLAVEVEDHPIAYAEFSGDIPEGEYGAGHVEIWDRGTYENFPDEKSKPRSMQDGIKSGRLEFRLHGNRLKGAFALVHFKKSGKRDNWLLIKMRDEHARTSTSDRTADSSKKEAVHRRSQRRRKGAPAVIRSGRTPGTIEFTHTDRIIFPESGVTKGDVLEYYDRIADHLLPHLIDRPITLERIPSGLTGPKAPHFWQKNTPEQYPAWIPRVELRSTDGEIVHYALVNNRQTLLYLVNQGTITFHPWMSRIGNLDHPDYVLFDLDPGERRFADAITVARHLHVVLTRMKMESYVKTSGKSGLHVLVPWTEKGDDAVARAWALEIATAAADELSDIATVERSRNKRGGRLYIDTLQNVRGHHAVPPYVLRATPHAAVSTPLRWQELTPDLTPGKFTIRTIFRRLGRMEHDPLEGFTGSWA